MLLDYLDKVREKPESHRRRVAFGSAVLITGLILLVWLTTLPAKFDTETVASQERNSPISTLGKNIAAAYDSVRGRVEFGVESLKNMWK